MVTGVKRHAVYVPRRHDRSLNGR